FLLFFCCCFFCFFFFSSRRRHTRSYGDWSSDVWLFRSQLRHLDDRGLVLPFGLHVEGHDDRLERGGLDGAMDRALLLGAERGIRSEERRVGKEGRYRWSRCDEKKKSREKTRKDDRNNKE